MNRSLRPALPRHDVGQRLGPLLRTRAAPDLFSRTRTYTFVLAALTCVGFALRVALLDAFPLREDEAIYGFWARAATTDPFFLHTWPDKPPLFIWLLQGTFALLGPSAPSARLVSIFASTLTVPLVAWGALALWRSRMAALLAALLFTFNPFAVSFAPTAYTDSLLALFGLGAVVCALRGRGLAAGILLAAACMTKQQGLLYVPLVVALLVYAPLTCWFATLRTRIMGIQSRTAASSFRAQRGIPSLAAQPTPQRGDSSSQTPRNDEAAVRGWAQLAWALLGAALVILPIFWWDSQRWAVAPSPWALAQQTYAPLTWLPPSQWWTRTHAWAEWLWYLGGNWIVWAMLGVALVVALGVAVRRGRVALVVAWGMAFVALHIVTSVQVWDRYLLPLAGWLALVASGPLAMTLARRWHAWVRGTLFLLLIIGMAETVVPGVNAAQGRLPIGGDHGDYAGLNEAMAWVTGQCGETPPAPQKGSRSPGWGGSRGRSDLLASSGNPSHTPLAARRQLVHEYIVPSPTWGGLGWGSLGWGSACPAVLYHQVLGWHFRFYLYNELQPHGDDPARFDLRWFPSAAYLADNAAKTPYPPKYLIVPEWATPRDLALHMALRGLTLEPRLRAGRFAVMEIVQPPRPACDWCKSPATRSGLPFMPNVLPMPEPELQSTP